MPLISHTQLPTFERLAKEGITVFTPERANQQDIRELHVGLLNMMPDAALSATERQFFRLLGNSNQIAQFYVHPFTLPELKRSEKAQQYIDEHYESFEQIKKDGLDALIITGANVVGAQLSNQPFWKPLIAVIDWAMENVTSTICSCLATHAVLEFKYQQKRQPLGYKRWGVFPHKVLHRSHPLVIDINTRFDIPHSRFNQISRKQFEDAGLQVLVEGEQDYGVHLAVSVDGFRTVFFQGHPEYDTISLLKEYKREVLSFAEGTRSDYPPFPDNYLSLRNQAILEEYRIELENALRENIDTPDFPESLIRETLDNTWHDSAEAVINNWIGKVYQITHRERGIPLMEGIDPKDPLGIQQP